MVHDQPLKDDFKRARSLFLALSIVSNIGAGMMSINMFKLAARDLRRIIHASPSLRAVFKMPRFIRSGPSRIRV